MEDAPRFERRLRKHFTLDFAIKIARICLDVNRHWSSTRASTHLELAWSVLVTLKRVWRLVELEMP